MCYTALLFYSALQYVIVLQHISVLQCVSGHVSKLKCVSVCHGVLLFAVNLCVTVNTKAFVLECVLHCASVC